MSRLFMAVLLLPLFAPSGSGAQTQDSLVKGQRVRVVAVCSPPSDCREGDPRWTHTGSLEALDQDSLRLRPQANDAGFGISTASIAHLYVSDGTRGHFCTGAGIGLVAGAVIGGAIGSSTEFCISECTHATGRAGAITVGAILGAPAGFLTGGIIGGRIRSDRWRLVSIGDHRIGVGPRLDAPGLIVDLRF